MLNCEKDWDLVYKFKAYLLCLISASYFKTVKRQSALLCISLFMHNYDITCGKKSAFEMLICDGVFIFWA